ncbi:MAG: HNH endonuclease [Bdellovibrio sp.]
MNPLSKISNSDLEFRLKNLVANERKLLHVILEHIREVDVRKIYLERAYSSLYEYLVKELRYSGSAAMRRLEAARLLKDVPILAKKIQEGSLNLSQIGELSRVLKEKEKTFGIKVSCAQKEELVSIITGKTTQETQKELSLALDIEPKKHDSQRMQQDESVRLEITLTKEQYQKLMTCKDLAAASLFQVQKDSSLGSLIEALSDQYLAKKIKPEAHVSSEQTKTETRTQAQTQTKIQTQTKTTSTKNGVKVTAKTVSETERVIKIPVNKTLTPKTRKAVLSRDLCCQFKDHKTSRQCKSTFALQVDHKTSRWAGGDHSVENLQVLCFQHNQLKYQRESKVRTV